MYTFVSAFTSTNKIFKSYVSVRFRDPLSTEGHFLLLVPDLRRLSVEANVVWAHPSTDSSRRLPGLRVGGFPKIRVSSSELNIFSVLRSRSAVRGENRKGEREKRYRDRNEMFLERMCQTILKGLCRALIMEKSASRLCHPTWEVWSACGNVCANVATRVISVHAL